jgi:hypothetical protein
LDHIPFERDPADGLASPSDPLVLKRNVERLDSEWSVPPIDPLEICNLWVSCKIHILHSESGELYFARTHSIKFLEKKEEETSA